MGVDPVLVSTISFSCSPRSAGGAQVGGIMRQGLAGMRCQSLPPPRPMSAAIDKLTRSEIYRFLHQFALALVPNWTKSGSTFLRFLLNQHDLTFGIGRFRFAFINSIAQDLYLKKDSKNNLRPLLESPRCQSCEPVRATPMLPSSTASRRGRVKRPGERTST